MIESLAILIVALFTETQKGIDHFISFFEEPEIREW